MDKMKRYIKAAAAVLIGCLLFAAGCSPSKMPKNCIVGGVDVSRMPHKQAYEVLSEAVRRAERERVFRVVGAEREYTFRFPQLYVNADIKGALLSAHRQSGAHPLDMQWGLHDFDDTLRKICDETRQKSRNARFVFDAKKAEPFTYIPETVGRNADEKRLKELISAALQSGENRVEIPFVRDVPSVTVAQLQQQTMLSAEFSTKYADGGNRAHNIALAAKKINGTVLKNGEEFSFNKTVGARTADRGFLSAPIIVGGDYKAGTGGGVCQMSTTLYNAALLSGMRISEYHPHSLKIGYVLPSFDAMVSGSVYDLKFRNETGKTAYIVAVAKGGVLTVRVYGAETERKFERKSVVLERIAPPPPEICSDCAERSGKEGMRSVGYLICREKNGTERSVKLRTDTYAPLRARIKKESA